MTSDLAPEFDRIAFLLDDLRLKIEACRRSILAARAAVYLGVATLAAVFTIATAYQTATVIFAAFTAILGGIVWRGASRSSMEEFEARHAELTQEQESLFDRVARRNGWDASLSETPGTLH